jgi:hypothetical protein
MEVFVLASKEERGRGREGGEGWLKAVERG